MLSTPDYQGLTGSRNIKNFPKKRLTSYRYRYILGAIKMESVDVNITGGSTKLDKRNLRLKFKILESKIPQRKIAQQLDISESIFSRITLGEREATLEQKIKIAEILNCSVPEIFPDVLVTSARAG